MTWSCDLKDFFFLSVIHSVPQNDLIRFSPLSHTFRHWFQIFVNKQWTAHMEGLLSQLLDRLTSL